MKENELLEHLETEGRAKVNEEVKRRGPPKGTGGRPIGSGKGLDARLPAVRVPPTLEQRLWAIVEYRQGLKGQENTSLSDIRREAYAMYTDKWKRATER